MIADVLALCLAVVMTAATADAVGVGRASGAAEVSVAAGVVAMHLFFLAQAKAYGAMTEGLIELQIVVRSSMRAMAVTVGVLFFAPVTMPRAWLAMLFAGCSVLLATARHSIRRALPWPRGPWRWRERVVIVGDNAEARAIEAALEREPGMGYDVLGLVHAGDRGGPVSGNSVLGHVDDTLEVAQRAGASGVIVATSAVDGALLNRLVRDLADHGVNVEVSSPLVGIAPHRLRVGRAGQFALVKVDGVCRNGWRSVAKRAFDVVVATAALVVLAPLLALVALAVRIDSRGPVLFHQRRVGRGGRPFRIHKFRTMVVDAELRLEEIRHLNEADGPLFKVVQDPRVTRVGKFLRASSLDELPQLVNVLVGEMSLVGPRPALPSEAERWSSALRNRLRVRPGMTGMWQVHGRSRVSFSDYERLDLYYVDNWSMAVDLALLLRTVPAVVSRRGAC